MTKKLKLPLRIQSHGTHQYTLSKSIHEGMVDLTSDDGTVYVQHITEAKAIEFFDDRTWTVVGVDSKSATAATTARANLELAKHAFADAKVTYTAAFAALDAAEIALAAATPYLV